MSNIDRPSFFSRHVAHACVQRILFSFLVFVFLLAAFSTFAAPRDHGFNVRDFGGGQGGNGHNNARLYLRLTQPLTFGEFTLGASGSVMVDPRAGTCSTRGGAVLIKRTCTRGVFELHGEPGDQVMVYLPAEATLTTAGSGTPGLMRDFKMDRENPIVIGTDGRTVVGFGATLSGDRNMRAGQYAGQFQVETMVMK